MEITGGKARRGVLENALIGFLSFVLLVVQPGCLIVSAGRLSKEGWTPWGLLMNLPLYATRVALAGYGLWIGLMLTRRISSAPWHAKLYFRCSVVAQLGLIAWALLTLPPTASGQFAGHSVWYIAFYVLWDLYFRRSERVASLYGRESLTSAPATKHIAIAGFAAIVLVGGTAGAVRLLWPTISQPWIPYAPIASGFEVLLPGHPTSTVTQNTRPAAAPIVVTDAVLETPASGVTFDVVYFDVSSEPSSADADVVFHSMRASFVDSLKVNITCDRRISLTHFPGREFVGDSGALRITERVYLAGRRVYQLITIAPTDASAGQVRAVEKFLNSFSLRPR